MFDRLRCWWWRVSRKWAALWWLDEYMSTPDDMGADWWDEFERERQQARRPDPMDVTVTDTSSTSTITPGLGADNIVIYGKAGTRLVTINLADGSMEFGPDYTPDEAARIFWDAVKVYIPTMGGR